MSATPGPSSLKPHAPLRPSPPGTALAPAETDPTVEQRAEVDGAVDDFERVDPADLEATADGGEALSEMLTRALDDDSRHDASR